MKTRKIVSILVIAIVAVMMIATVITNDQYVDAASKKVKKVKVTYNANGGKIGSKKTISTNINKGTKLKKFPTTPKRTGYTFKGWYTKKTGGKKITVNTKPTKNVILYAQWKKGSSISNGASNGVLTAEEKKLVGTWKSGTISMSGTYYYRNYIFRDDGTFMWIDQYNSNIKSGNYKVSAGKITFTNIKWRFFLEDRNDYPNTVVEYKFKNDSSGNVLLQIPSLDYSNKNYLSYDGYYANYEKVK